MKRFFVIMLILLPTLIWAQFGSGGGKNSKIIRGTVCFQSFSVENVDNSISEFSFPIQIIWPVNSDLNLQLQHTPASSAYGDYKLAGISDTYLKANYLLLNQRILVGLGLGLPTGPTQLDAEEFLLTQMLSNNALRFHVPVLGQGLTGTLGFALALPVNDKLVFGTGANYVFRNKYKPVENSIDDYDPGDFLGINLGSDFQVSESTKLFFDLLYTLYFADRIKGHDAFGAGDKLSVDLGLFMELDLMTILTNFTFRQKGKNELWTGTELAVEDKNSNGPQFEFDGILRYSLNEQVGLRGLCVLRAFGENEKKTGDAAVFGLGGGADFQLSPKAMMDVGLKGYFGRLGGGSAAQQLSGFELIAGFSYYF